MCYYTQWRQRVKRVWNKVLYRLDAYQKQRAIHRWNMGAHNKYRDLLARKQADMTEFIQNMNEEIGQMHDQDTGDLNFIKDQNKVQRKIAYR